MFEWAVELVSGSCDKTRNTTNSSLFVMWTCSGTFCYDFFGILSSNVQCGIRLSLSYANVKIILPGLSIRYYSVSALDDLVVRLVIFHTLKQSTKTFPRRYCYG